MELDGSHRSLVDPWLFRRLWLANDLLTTLLHCHLFIHSLLFDVFQALHQLHLFPDASFCRRHLRSHGSSCLLGGDSGPNRRHFCVFHLLSVLFRSAAFMLLEPFSVILVHGVIAAGLRRLIIFGARL